MRTVQVVAISGGALLAAASLTSSRILDRDTLTQKKDEAAFFVEVVANGVPTNGVPYIPTRDQKGELIGLDLWIGAQLAYEDLKKEKADHMLQFQLVPRDDRDDVGGSLKIAETIQREPRALAVIGHGITKTTHAASEIYGEAGVPVIVALATADTAMTGTSASSRLPNMFRLSPSDGQVQAPAIAYFISTHAPADRSMFDVHLFESTSDQAGE